MKLTLALVLVAATAACDRLATGSFKPPYVTIAGQIDSSTATAMPKNVHIAILWENDQSAGSNYAVQPIDVLAQFPASFRVPITERPQAQVVNTLQTTTAIGLGLDPAMSWAIGTLVVFADGDGNGELTITQPGFPHSPDQVLAADLDIFYLGSGHAGAAADCVGIFPITTGFSLVPKPPTRDPKPGDCGGFTAHGHYSDSARRTMDSVPLDVGNYTEHMHALRRLAPRRLHVQRLLGTARVSRLLLAAERRLRRRWLHLLPRLSVSARSAGGRRPRHLPPDSLSYVYKHCVDHASCAAHASAISDMASARPRIRRRPAGPARERAADRTALTGSTRARVHAPGRAFAEGAFACVAFRVTWLLCIVSPALLPAPRRAARTTRSVSLSDPSGPPG